MMIVWFELGSEEDCIHKNEQERAHKYATSYIDPFVEEVGDMMARHTSCLLDS